jgi:hypothetical protein
MKGSNARSCHCDLEFNADATLQLLPNVTTASSGPTRRP